MQNIKKLIEENAEINAYVSIGFGAAGVVFFGFNLGTSLKSGFMELSTDVIGLGYSIDQITLGYNTLAALEKGIFDENVEYSYFKGMLVAKGGEFAGLMYDVGGLIIGGRSMLQKLGTIKGSKLNEMVREKLSLANDAANTANTIKTRVE